MKLQILIPCGAIALLSTPSHADLIGHWKMDDSTGTTLVDSVGGKDATEATAGGSDFIFGVAGVDGTAVRFTGADHFQTSTDPADLYSLGGGGTGAYTLSFWYNRETFATTTALDSIAGFRQGNNNVGMNLDDGTNVGFTHRDGVSGTAWRIGNLNPIADDTWYHLVATYDGDALTFYGTAQGDADGVDVISSQTGAALTWVDRQLRIGGGHFGNVKGGLIDDIQVYDTGLSTEQVQFLFDNPGSGLSGPAGPTLKISQSGATLDFEWNSTSGMQYDLVSSSDLSTAPDTWPAYNDGVLTYENLPADGTGTNTLSGVLPIGLTRFFAVTGEPVPPLFFEDFEDDDGGFTQVGEWEHGPPDSNNGFSPVSEVTGGNGGSTNCWATKLGTWQGGVGDAGFITPSTDSKLRSPDIDLTGISGASLTFAAAIDAAAADTVEVNLRDAGTHALLGAVLYAPVPPDGDLNAAKWEELGPFDLSAGDGLNVYLEFRFLGTDATYIGWYLDDVTITAP